MCYFSTLGSSFYGVIAITCVAVAQPPYSLRSSVIASATGSTLSGPYRFSSVAGQPTPVGTTGASAGPYTLLPGFVPTLNTGSDTQGPSILQPAISTRNSGDTLRVVVSIQASSGIESATLCYRKGGEPAWTSAGLVDLGGGSYSTTVPATFVTAAGMEYYVKATDKARNMSRAPLSGAWPVRVTVTNLAKSELQPGGNAQNAYRLISAPLDPSDNRITSLIPTLALPYDKTTWRFFEFKPESAYVEYPNVDRLLPGRSYWLITKDAKHRINTGVGTSRSTTEPFSVDMRPGWNAVSNPYAFPIPVTQLRLTNGRPVDVREFSGQWTPPKQIEALRPFEGYMLACTTETQLIIDGMVPPVPTKKQTAAAPALWAISIQGQIQEARDSDNTSGVFENACSGEDGVDAPEPPAVGDFVSISFPHPEWNGVFTKYCVDARPVPRDGETWKFEVASNIVGRVRLSFHGVASVPDRFDVWLVDDLVNITQNVRTSAEYSFAQTGSVHARPMTLIVGTASYVMSRISDMGTEPMTFELSQNFPNPFNPVTVIRYGLPLSAQVTLKVYDVLGRTVEVLVNGETQDRGFRTVEFDGCSLSSGVYFYRIEAGNFRAVKKMELLR